METQLVLLENDDKGAWKLDEETRARGRKGVALARAALIDATRRVAA